MAVSPNTPENLAREIGRVYAQAERDVIQRIANRMVTDKSLPISEWEAKKLSNLRKVRSGIEQQIKRKLDNFTDKELQNVIEEAYGKGLDSAVADLRKYKDDADIPITEGFTRLDERTIEDHVKALKGKLQGTHLRIISQAGESYQQAVARGANFVLTGAGTRVEGSQKVLNELANRGITGFTDKAGRNWNLNSYAEMATRTEVGQAATEAHMNRLQENGEDLVVVSSHLESCPICDPWEGRVMSISGDSDKYPPVDEAIDDGLFHPNCGHSLGAYIEGLTEPPEPQPGEEEYEDRQEQRRLERGVRKWKRRESASMTEDAEQKAKGKVREWQGRLREFTDDKDRRRKYSREQIEQAR